MSHLVSTTQAADASAGYRDDASSRAAGDAVAVSSERRVCGWCRQRLEVTARGEAMFCGQKCRQAAFRLRRRRATAAAHDAPMRMAYADPPYPGLSSKYYGDQPSFAGEVDHRALVASLEASGYDGWALSTAARSLRDVLPICPPGARVCAWVKPIGACPQTHGLHNTWEPLIVVRGRQRQPGKPDWLRAQPARFGGELPGRKPIAFCAWLFDCLGMVPGDELVDLFPGTGVVGRAWLAASSTAPSDVAEDLSDATQPVGEVLARHPSTEPGR